MSKDRLGLELLTDVTPSIDTYYLFRRRICEDEDVNGVDLMLKCFEQVASDHVRLLKISGKCVRMDSKLIGSSIARQSRYELIHTTLVKFLKANSLSVLFPELRDKKSVKTDTLQNPNDPDASFRDKNDLMVQGYVTNITETVEEGKPSIITSVTGRDGSLCRLSFPSGCRWEQ